MTPSAVFDYLKALLCSRPRLIQSHGIRAGYLDKWTGRVQGCAQYVNGNIQHRFNSDFDLGAIKQAHGGQRLNHQIDVAALAFILQARAIKPHLRVVPRDFVGDFCDGLDLLWIDTHRAIFSDLGESDQRGAYVSLLGR